MYNFVITDNTINLTYGDEIYSFQSSYPDFGDIVKACHTRDDNAVEVFVRKFTENLYYFGGRVYSKAGIMYINVNGVIKSVNPSMHTRISELAAQGKEDDLEGILNMLDKLYKNPNVDAIEDMFRFLQHNSLPITREGNFVAYKLVRADYKDIYSGKFDNSIGATPSMPREACEDDRTVTCSRGLHFCSKEYLPHYGNMDSRIMVLEISPTDVVSIPVDYNNAKGRACTYKIVGEIPNGRFRDEAIAVVESSVVVKLGNLINRIKSFFKPKGN